MTDEQERLQNVAYVEMLRQKVQQLLSCLDDFWPESEPDRINLHDRMQTVQKLWRKRPAILGGPED